MRFFDRLCGIVEAHLPTFIPALKAAKLFDFPYIPHEILPKRFEGDREDVAKSFFLPFDCIAIEDTASLVVIFDLYPGQEGLDAPRGFIDLLPLMAPDAAYKEFKEGGSSHGGTIRGKPLEWWHRRGFALVSVGRVDRVVLHSAERLEIKGSTVRAMMASKNEILRDRCEVVTEQEQKKRREMGLPPIDPRDPSGALNNCLQAIQEILYFNQPDKFVLRERQLNGKPKKQKKKKHKIARERERPRYTILRPHQIREKMGLPVTSKDGRKLPEPTWVRTHWRFLKSRIYSKGPDGEELPQIPIPWGPDKGQMHYKRTKIPAYHTGPEQVVRDGKEYRIMLEI